MPQPPRSARGTRTREALRRAAEVRFLAQGVEETSAEQIAADAGVSLRTFYRHFSSKRDLLFSDYDAGLEWFRQALHARPAEEPVTDAVLAAIESFPFERERMYEIAALRDRELDREQVDRHIRQVQAEFGAEVERHLLSGAQVAATERERFLVSVTAQCVAAATFAALRAWLSGEHSDVAELSGLTRLALDHLAGGLAPLGPAKSRRGGRARNGNFAKIAPP